jgi:predicted sulfurtransferase
LESIPYFRDIPDIDSKANSVAGHEFEKMTVKYRDEIVAL